MKRTLSLFSAARSSRPTAIPTTTTAAAAAAAVRPSWWWWCRETQYRPRRCNSSSSSSSSKPVDFYTLFPKAIPQGPPPAGPFNVDPRALQREFFALQQRSHPDTPAHVRTADTPSSAYINAAYTTLRDPLLRAQYLLQRHGVNVADDETLKLDGASDQELLLEVMETQEAIAAAKREEDLANLADWNDERIEHSIEALEKAFAEDDVETAKRETIRLRYWRNIEDAIRAWEKGKPVVLEH